MEWIKPEAANGTRSDQDSHLCRLLFGVGFGVTYLLTGSVSIATGVALIEPAVNTVVFFLHEKVWRRIGRTKPAATAAVTAHASRSQDLAAA